MNIVTLKCTSALYYPDSVSVTDCKLERRPCLVRPTDQNETAVTCHANRTVEKYREVDYLLICVGVFGALLLPLPDHNRLRRLSYVGSHGLALATWDLPDALDLLAYSFS